MPLFSSDQAVKIIQIYSRSISKFEINLKQKNFLFTPSCRSVCSMSLIPFYETRAPKPGIFGGDLQFHSQ